jgi:hypothetical protein
LGGAGALTPVEAANLKVLDKYTLRVPMTRPYASFVENLGDDLINIVPVGFDAKKPVGTALSSTRALRLASRASLFRMQTIGSTRLTSTS